MKRAYLHTPAPIRPDNYERLLEVFDYDKETGIIRWKIETHGRGRMIYPGDVAGYISRGYRLVNYQGKNYFGHRLAWLLVTGEYPPKGLDIDHINRNPSDNRWINLRLATRGQNNINTYNEKRGRKDGYKGVYLDRLGKNWFARIYIDNERIHLGTFNTFEEAVAARQAAERQYYPGLKE